MFILFFVVVDWLVEYIDDLEIQIIDVCMVFVGQEVLWDMVVEYCVGYVLNVLFFDIEVLFDYISLLLYMMLWVEVFVVVMCELGVCSDKYLVVYDEGNLFFVLCVWWMLCIFGVEKVLILVGGLEGWWCDELLLE